MNSLWTFAGMSKYDFAISLDDAAARRFLAANHQHENQRKLADLANTLLREIGHHLYDPFSFVDDTLLCDQLTLGSDGKWLAAPANQYAEAVRSGQRTIPTPLRYTTHNIGSAQEAYTLIRLFDVYAKYAVVALDMPFGADDATAAVPLKT